MFQDDGVNEKVMEGHSAMDNLTTDKKVTEEEFQNFMNRVTEVGKYSQEALHLQDSNDFAVQEKIVKKLASSDVEEQKIGQMLADEMLERKVEKDFSEVGDLRIMTDRTVINKYRPNESNSDQNNSSQGAFMRSVEKDAKERAENRKIRNERAETLKRIANGAFNEGNYEKAVTYYSQAIEQRKDSSVLWNSRALSYINLGLFEKAILDCEWALKVNNANLKALLNTAKCYKHLENEEKCKEFLELARERNPHFKKFINEFEENLAKGNI